MSIYDEIEIEDMDFRSTERTFYYSCPCGDRFFITLVSRHARTHAGFQDNRSPGGPIAG